MKMQHHSLADWDFLYAPTWNVYHRYDLYSGVFVSPPTCLRFDPWPLDGNVYALSNLPLAQNLPAGKMTTWAYHQGAGVGKTYFHIGVTGIGSLGIQITIQKKTGTFGRRRIDWWQGTDGLGNPATLVDAYNWDGSNWVLTGSSTHPPITGPVNRIGIGITPQSLSSDTYWDDTEIWLPI